jgi:hypothetical protein
VLGLAGIAIPAVLPPCGGLRRRAVSRRVGEVRAPSDALWTAWINSRDWRAPDLICAVQIRSIGPETAIPLHCAQFAKETLCFTRIEPAVHLRVVLCLRALYALAPEVFRFHARRPEVVKVISEFIFKVKTIIKTCIIPRKFI